MYGHDPARATEPPTILVVTGCTGGTPQGTVEGSGNIIECSHYLNKGKVFHSSYYNDKHNKNNNNRNHSSSSSSSSSSSMQLNKIAQSGV